MFTRTFQKTLGETVPVLRVITRPRTHTCNFCCLLPSAALCIRITSPTICQTRRRSRNMPALNWICLKCTRTNACGIRLRDRSRTEDTGPSSVALFMIRGQNSGCQRKDVLNLQKISGGRAVYCMKSLILHRCYISFAGSAFLNSLPRCTEHAV